MQLHIDRIRFVGLLFFATIATYVLIALGTAVSSTGGAESCTTWPACESNWTFGPITAELALFWGHRVAALVAGILLALVAIGALRLDVDRYTAGSIGVAAILYPVQVGLGATLVGSDSRIVGGLHLALAMIIFATMLIALARSLETLTERRTLTGDREGSHGSTISGPSLTGANESRTNETGGDFRDSTHSSTHEDEYTTVGDGEAATTAAAPDAAVPLGRVRSPYRQVRRRVGAYVALTKPRLMWLLCLVAVAGMGLAVASGGTIRLTTAVATLLGGVLAIGAAGAFNQVYERDRDERMHRTDDRPLVHDRVPARNAYAFVLLLTAASTAVVLTWVNFLATVLTLAAIGYYAIIYTVVLKPHTAWNTVLGGGAGAIPALIGWAAVTGDIGWPALVLALVIFLWTPAHFYSLAIAYREDYARGGFPMLPVVAGELVARRHVLGYLGATMLAVSLLGWIAGLGLLYAIVSVALGVVFLRSVVHQYVEPTTERALRSFYVSNAYLGVLLLAITLESGLALF